MTRPAGLGIVLSGFLAAGAINAPASRQAGLTKEARLEFIQRAQVWTRTDVSRMDLRAGPNGLGRFQPNQIVDCEFVDAGWEGHSRKFHCAVADGDVVKVRYGAHNWEVQGSVLATRLLWALGFAADRVYPVRVRCRGCSSDPWRHRQRVPGEHLFDPAVIERKPPGHEMRTGDKKAGWAWRELDIVDEDKGGAPVQQRDALKLLAVFMQHTDTKPEQQRLLCLSDGFTTTGWCDKPFMMLHDVGVTFGRANTYNRSDTGSVNLTEWARTPVWKDAAHCVGYLPKSHTGTLDNPRISEAGRLFLARLLVELSDRQLRDLFEVAGVNWRQHTSEHLSSQALVDEWIAAFKGKRDQVVMNHCTG